MTAAIADGMTIIAAALILAAGLFIGMVGIGGVLVVPALTEIAHVEVGRAIAASMFAFLLAGIVAVVLSRQSIKAPRRDLVLINLAALAGAASGALLLDLLPVIAIKLFVAALAIVSGGYSLVGMRAQDGEPRSLSAAALIGIGLFVGGGSAISGTGGPVMLIPILMMASVPIRNAIAFGQVIQLPIALSATSVNAAQGRLDPALAVAVGCAVVASSLAGLWLSKRIATRLLKQGVAIGLVALGLWYAYSSL